MSYRVGLTLTVSAPIARGFTGAQGLYRGAHPRCLLPRKLRDVRLLPSFMRRNNSKRICSSSNGARRAKNPNCTYMSPLLKSTNGPCSRPFADTTAIHDPTCLPVPNFGGQPRSRVQS